VDFDANVNNDENSVRAVDDSRRNVNRNEKRPNANPNGNDEQQPRKKIFKRLKSKNGRKDGGAAVLVSKQEASVNAKPQELHQIETDSNKGVRDVTNSSSRRKSRTRDESKVRQRSNKRDRDEETVTIKDEADVAALDNAQDRFLPEKDRDAVEQQQHQRDGGTGKRKKPKRLKDEPAAADEEEAKIQEGATRSMGESSRVRITSAAEDSRRVEPADLDEDDEPRSSPAGVEKIHQVMGDTAVEERAALATDATVSNKAVSQDEIFDDYSPKVTPISHHSILSLFYKKKKKLLF
jgi:hypothetical protein